MPPDPNSQIIEQLNTANNILIVLPQNPTADSLSAGLALRLFFRKLEKEVTVVSPTPLDPKYNFLEGFGSVSNSLSGGKNFVIEVSTKRTQIEELSYHKESDHLAIHIKPKQGEFKESDITFNTADYPYNLIITVGIASLDQLGNFYTQNAEMFFKLPIINIDYRANNEAYGQFNLIQLNSTSTSEVIMDLIVKFESNLIDGDIATNLLTGIITETNSFQHTRTTPETFIKASQLVGQGARQQQIISSLYRTKTMSFLKLWGRALARLKQDNDVSLVYTVITQNDFQKSQASLEEVEMVIPELTNQLKMARVFLVLHELSESVTAVYCQLPSAISAQTIFGGFELKHVTPQIITFNVPVSLSEAETTIVKGLRDELVRLNA
ncbi:MAG TPA: DHH family phosphoesterase [Verrucomicrobiae bacterium]|nr:DHH family phosphoesterase [Verrucomicrobiae bacterium]